MGLLFTGNIVSNQFWKDLYFQADTSGFGILRVFRFRFDPQSRFFRIEPCGLEDDGAEALPNYAGEEYYDICSMSLVRFVYQTCGWNKTISYRVPGRVYGSDSHLVYFDLKKAYEIHEGRVMKIENTAI